MVLQTNFYTCKWSSRIYKKSNNKLYISYFKGLGIPLGVSGLNPPNRYMADIYIKASYSLKLI